MAIKSKALTSQRIPNPTGEHNHMATKKQSTAMISMQEEMAKELANVENTVTIGGGNTIKVDQKNGEYFEIPELGQAESPMSVVIVDYVTQHKYWGGRYDPNNVVPPDCFAIGKNVKELKPSANSPEAQADACNGCPMNEFGSNGNGKACKNTRVLAVLPPDADSSAAIMKLVVSPSGLKAFDNYVAGLAAKLKTLPIGVVTDVSIVPTKSQGYTLAFGNPRPNENLETDFGRRDEAQMILNQEPDLSHAGGEEVVAAPKRRTTRKKAPVRRKTAARR